MSSPAAVERAGAASSAARLRLAIVVNMVAPYTKPLFESLARRHDCDLLVLSETPMERDRRWAPETELSFEHVLLESWTLDFSRLAVGSGFRTRFDTYAYVPRRPLRALQRFKPDVVVAGGGGIWSSPTNIAVLAARRRRGWAFVPWWGSFTRPRPTLPRRVANPWVKAFMRASDAWLVYGTRQARDVIQLGADPDRVVIAPITPLEPEHAPASRDGRTAATTRFLFVGRLIERKGLDVLLEAVRAVSGCELWVAGDGPLRPMLAAAAAQDDRIRLLGHTAGRALAEAYREADVLVVPSLYEPWGLVVHEGLAYGLPVIATDQVGAADDLVQPGVNGEIVPAGSAAALARAMSSTAAWSGDRYDDARRYSEQRLRAFSIERAVAGFVHGCSIAVEHRRARALRPEAVQT